MNMVREKLGNQFTMIDLLKNLVENIDNIWKKVSISAKRGIFKKMSDWNGTIKDHAIRSKEFTQPSQK